MIEINIKSDFGQIIKQIWTDQKYSEIPIIHRGFCVPEKILTDSIMLIGINPSFAGNEEGNEIENYYCLNQTGNYRYFKKFEKISDEACCQWSHFDLTFFREANQNFIDKLMRFPHGIDFICQQLNISKRIIEISKPKILVVANTKARQFLGKEKKDGKNEWMNLDFEFDPLIGTDRITSKSSNLHGIPVFFTSMLTGQRALDNGSFERLLWHITKLLDQKEMNLP